MQKMAMNQIKNIDEGTKLDFETINNLTITDVFKITDGIYAIHWMRNDNPKSKIKAGWSLKINDSPEIIHENSNAKITTPRVITILIIIYSQPHSSPSFCSSSHSFSGM